MNLFRNYEKNFEDLQKNLIDLGASLAEDYDTVKNQCETIQKTQNEYEREFIALYEKQDEIFEQLKEIKELLQPPKTEVPDIKVEPVTIEDSNLNEYSFNGIKLLSSYQVDYGWTEIDALSFKFKRDGRGKKTSSYTIFDVLLLIGLENEKTWENWKSLERLTGIGEFTIKVIAYNYKKGFFDNFDFNGVVNFSKEFGMLYINGKKTSVTIKTARYIVDCITNSNNPMTTLLKLSKGSECSNLMYKLIGTNYKNTQLTSLLYNEVHVPIENNPQKRKELGM